MGKKLDALLGRGFKINKFKATVNIAISRLAILRNQHQARCNVARSDVIQMLKLGHHERALLRVEQVVKEQNMVDVYTMIEIYCYLLIQRVSLLEQAKECPEELKEAASSLIYACSRCGEFPELHEIRAIFTSRFGKEFVARAVELRNYSGVNPKIIQKLSTRMPSTESRLQMLKEMAVENNIVLQIQEPDSLQSEAKKDSEKKQDEVITEQSNELGDSEIVDGLSDSVQMRRKYKDVGQAAQAAFESAAYAAAAARAAVELFREDSQDPESPRTPSPRPPKFADSTERMDGGQEEQIKKKEKEYLFERSISESSMDSEDKTLKKIEDFSDEEEIMAAQRNKIMFDDTDSKTKDRGRVLSFENHVTESGIGYSLQSNEVTITENLYENEKMSYPSDAGYSVYELKNQQESSNKGKMHSLSITGAPVSVRTR